MTSTRRPRLISAALLVAAAFGMAAAPSVLAQDGKKKGQNAGQGAAQETPPELTAQQKELKAIGAAFKAKDIEKLMSWVPEKSKIRLALGQYDTTCRKGLARTNITAWLASRTITQVKLKDSKDPKSLTGRFTLKFRRNGKNEKLVKELEIRIRKKGDKYVLTKIVVQ